MRGKGLPSIEERADRWFVNFSRDEIAMLLKELHGEAGATLTSETLMVRLTMAQTYEQLLLELAESDPRIVVMTAENARHPQPAAQARRPLHRRGHRRADR